jgi:HPt (histidine-containing phosphotransfer) domain-containing protein
LQAARALQDLPSIRHVVHTLKSSSASIGALEFSMRCAEVEMMIRQQQTEGLDLCLQGLEDESTRVRATVQAMLAS